MAEGLYAGAGLDVTIRQGGPQMNHAQLLAAGRIDISAVPNSFIPLNYIAQNIPMVAVAAIFQKDPAVLIAHAGQGNDSLAALKGKKIMISPDTRIGFWRFLKSKYGFTDDQIAPYTFNLAPFLADPKAIQQGLAHQRAVPDRAHRPKAGGDAARGFRLRQLRLGDHHVAQAGRREARRRAPLRRRQHQGLDRAI